jgi:serine/threonine protein kinase
MAAPAQPIAHAMMRIPGGEGTDGMDRDRKEASLTEPKPPERTWSEAMDLDAAGRVLEALDQPEPESSTPDADNASVPSIEGYGLDGRLGGGGGGEVYRAVRIGSDRPLAIKILNQRIGETPEARRAWRELDVLEQLRLPCLPRLIDHGITDGRMYLAMEFVEGHAILDHCRVNDLDRAARVALLAEVADAVQSLHEHGVIHRDIKPSNILIDSHGQPVLIDLGIAALLSRSAAETLTREGMPIGSPAYMAPEQARGEKDAVSTRSDVYGLGATGYVLLTGQTPHDMDATLHEAIRRVAFDEPRPAREIDRSLPRPLAAVLGKACARKPDSRYESPGELARDLRRWLNREPVEAGGLSLPQRLGRFVARHPSLTTALTCSLFIVATIIASYVVVWWLNGAPYEIEVDPANRAWARLLSRDGRIIREWNTGISNGVSFGELIEADRAWCGRRLVCLGFGGSIPAPDLSEFAGKLCVFELDDLANPVWASGGGPPDLNMPPPISHVGGEDFRTSSALIEDIFPDVPGSEIVVTHSHMPHSPYAVRIHATDDDGTVLYEVWHDGYVNPPYWMPAPGLLVFTGVNSEAGWADRGHPGRPATQGPLIVFAIRPERGQLIKDWLHTPGGRGRFEAVWYQCVFPATCSRLIDNLATGVRLIRPDEVDGPESHVWLHLLGESPPFVDLHLLLDERGVEVDRYKGDRFKKVEGLPGPEDIYLGPLPPIVPTGAP